MGWILFYIFLFISLCCVNSTSVRVNILQGTLEGKVLQTANGFAYQAFLGIPFAKPPIGKLRFRDPVAADRWSGVLNATNDANICAQVERLFKKAYIGEEDCLYLNVYVPGSAIKNDRFSVMFWVHGGAFLNGNGNAEQFGPDHLIEKNVIVVTTNYRLGPLGFLSLDTLEAPGNVGLKDQALALKWVNRNIRRFGGNSHDITIFGQSAGGASINFLTMSPLTRGLYSKAILESGTSQNEWALQTDNINNAFKLGALLGVQTTDKSVLVNALVNMPLQQLVVASYSPTLGSNPLFPAFVPVVEKNIPGASTFLNKDPRTIMNSNRYTRTPIMIGYVSQEGYMGFYAMGNQLAQVLSPNATLSVVIPDFKIYIPAHLRLRMASDTMEVVAQKIKSFYFHSNVTLVDGLLNLLTDAAFVKDIDFTAKAFSKRANTYYYRFSFRGSLNEFNLFYPGEYKEASHGDELGYLFSPKFESLSSKPVPIVTDREKLTIQRMTEMWTNFAKYGNPTPKTSEAIKTIWKPISRNKVNCLVIDNELTLIDNPLAERIKFWEQLEIV